MNMDEKFIEQELKDITERFIDSIENEEENKEKIILSLNIGSSDDRGVLSLEENYKSNNVIITQLLNSNDQSTHNVGILFNMIETEFPDYLNTALNILSDNLSYDNDVVKYMGKALNYYTLYGTISVLKKVLVNKEHYGNISSLLESVINVSGDKDYEFYAYFSFLNNYKGNKDQVALGDILETLVRCYEQESTRELALDNMRKLVILIEYTGLTFSYVNDGAYYDVILNEVCLNKIYKNDSTTLHEFGHAIDKYFSPRDKNVRPNELFARAIDHINNNPRSFEIIDEMQSKLGRINDIASTMYDNVMKEKYGSIEGALEMYERIIRKKIKSGEIYKYLEKMGVSEDLIGSIFDDILDDKLDVKKVAKLLYKTNRDNHCYMCLYQKEEGAFMDIIGSIYGSRVINLNGNEINLFMGHSKEYYDSCPDNSMTEIMANLNSLFVLGRFDLLRLLKEVIGDELWEFLMSQKNAGQIISYENQSKHEKRVA